MQLKQIVPFGRSLDEYIHMFKLTADDLNLRILGVGDGPASFNAELTARGGQVVSVDPLYEFDADDIRQRFDAVIDDIIGQVEATPENWVWSYHRSPQHLRLARMDTMQRFIADYSLARSSKPARYVAAALPDLPFAESSFDLALCSHLLFLYSAHLDAEFHVNSIKEMLRVAREVRVFPLLDLQLEKSRHLARVMNELSSAGFSLQIQRTTYELQRGGNEMLRIWRSE